MRSLQSILAARLQKRSIRWNNKKKHHLAAKAAYYNYKLGKENPESLLDIAALEMKAEKYTQAILYITKYLEINKESNKAMLLLGIAYRQNGDYENAIKTHLQCLKKQEGDANILYTLGLDNERAGKGRTAKRYYARAIETEKSFAKAYFRLAQLYMQDKKYDLAVNLYLDGLSLREGTPKEWINLSMCYIKTSNFNAAEKVLIEASKNFPNSVEVKFALGTTYIKKREYKKVGEIISQLDEKDDKNLILSLKVKEALDRKEYENLSELLEQFEKEDKTDEYWYMLAIAEGNTGNEEKAIKALRKALEINPELRKEAKKDDNFAQIRELVEIKHILYQRN